MGEESSRLSPDPPAVYTDDALRHVRLHIEITVKIGAFDKAIAARALCDRLFQHEFGLSLRDKS